MKKLTIEQAVEMRKQLKHTKENRQKGFYSYGERQVLTGILNGDYDHYIITGGVVEISNEDIDLLDKVRVKC